jgi:hypothetical protein
MYEIVCISEQTAIISLHSIKWSVFTTGAENVYSAVRAGSLNQTDPVSSLDKLEVPQLHKDASEQICLVPIRLRTVINSFYVRTEQLCIYWTVW